MRVVFVVLDGLPPDRVGPEVTPNLWRLGREGSLATCRGVMAASTYPNHATFATGVPPAVHGLVGNWVVTADGPRPAHEVGPGVPTVFEACREAGRRSALVVGDHHLVGVMGGAGAHWHWPPGGRLPPGVGRDAHGFAADREVLPRILDALDDRPDLLVAHLNEPDTAGHVFGPASPQARVAYRATDAVLGDLVDALRPGWRDTVLMVVSDHGMETLVGAATIDLSAAVADRGLIVVPEGGAAAIWGDDPHVGRWLDDVPGVAGHHAVAPGVRLAWAQAGRSFALPAGFDESGDLGQHGGIGTLSQVAAAGGGHGRAADLAVALASGAEQLTAPCWAPTIARLLGLPLPQAMGRSLV